MERVHSDAEIWARLIVDCLTGTDNADMIDSVTEALQTFSAAERQKELARMARRAILQ